MTLQLLEQFAPGLSAFTVSINDGQQFFGAIFERSHQNQHTTAFFIQADVEINAVGPPVNVTFGAQVAPAPGLIFFFPTSLESHHIGGG
jgi:hypothetical protein